MNISITIDEITGTLVERTPGTQTIEIAVEGQKCRSEAIKIREGADGTLFAFCDGYDFQTMDEKPVSASNLPGLVLAVVLNTIEWM